MRPIATGLLIALVILCGANRALAADQGSVPGAPKKAVAVFAPRPDYPYEARRARITGRGIVVQKVDPLTGEVTSARMAQSTGSTVLDGAALAAFRRWRFKPGTVSMVKIPINFTVGGQVVTEYQVKQKPMDEALAHFLGKGTVAKGPIPEYPRVPPWTNKQGKGVYELHVQKDGTVSGVKVLKSSGDETFDRVTVDTLRKWKLRRGPLVLELPLHFILTPLHYSVDIPKDR